MHILLEIVSWQRRSEFKLRAKGVGI